MAIHNEAGRGRKFCQNCKKYVGVRSRSCPNCSAVFGPSLKVSSLLYPPKSREVTEESEESISEPVVGKESEENAPGKGSRIARIEYLKQELIRELKISSRSYGQGIVDEISKALGG